MTDSTTTRDYPATAPVPGAGRPGRYLPSAQVLAELSGLADLGSLADELRRCLSESPADRAPSRS